MMIDPINNLKLNSETKSQKPKGKRGFASMDREKQREIARKGGKAAHEKGTAHEWTPNEARLAGRKGGSHTIREVPTRTSIIRASDIVIGAPIFSLKETTAGSSPSVPVSIRTSASFTTATREQ